MKFLRISFLRRFAMMAGLVVLAGNGAMQAAAPVVSNVRAAQRAGTQLVDIYYDLVDADSATLSVMVAVSTNAGASYNVAASSFTGALGSSVTPGSNKQIVWNAGIDLPSKLFSNVRVRITASDQSNGLMAYYPFNGNANDVSGNGHRGTVYGATLVPDRKGSLDNAYFFYGTNGFFSDTDTYISIGNGISVAQFTLSAWIKIERLQPDQITIFSKIHNLPGSYFKNFELAVGPNGRVYGTVPTGSPFWPTVSSSQSLTTNRWYFLVLTYDGQRGKLFLDSVKEPNETYGAFADSDVEMTIGARPETGGLDAQTPSGKGGFFFGTIDDVRIYSRALSGMEIEQLYQFDSITAETMGVSAVITIDLHGSNLNVQGRVRHAFPEGEIAGVLVSLAGHNTVTFGDGVFSFSNVFLASGDTITASKTGYMTALKTVRPIPGSKTVVVPDIILVENSPGKPVVTSVEPRLKGLFLSGVRQNNEFTASVNWNGLTPGAVRFFANGVQIADRTGSGPEYVCSVDMADPAFRPAFSLTANKVTVQAVSSSGEASQPFDVYLDIIPTPDPIKLLTFQNWPFTTYLDGHIGLDFDIPSEPIKADLTLPVLGRFGFEVAATASFDYTVTDGDWEAAFGVGAEGNQGKRGRRPSSGLTRNSKMKLYVGNKEISGKLEGGFRGTATLQSGITFDTAFGRGEIEAKLELGRIGLPDLVGPGLSTALSHVPGLGDVAKSVSVVIYVIPRIEGDVTFALQPAFAFDTFEMTGKVGLEAAYEPKLTEKVKMRLYVGGEPSVTIQTPGDLFKNVRFKAYAGVEFDLWLLTIHPPEYVFVDVSYPAALRSTDKFASSLVQMKTVRPDGAEIRPVSRDYLKNGGEGFAMMDSTLIADSTVFALERFRQMGQAPAKSSATAETTKTHTQSFHGENSTSYFSQADLTIASNVFPGSEPALANRGQELMLLYVTDNGSPNDLQFTDIRWTRWDGTNWSTPLTIHTNTQAEFAPQVAYDGNGNAIAIWERVADTNFNQTNLTAMAAQMEIVWSKWNRTNGIWSMPVALTANSVLDHAPLLCGPMSNGSVLAVWTRNQANLLMGTNGAGSQLWRTQWNVTNQSWSVPQLLLADLPSRLSQSLAGVSNRAVYVWTCDLDGVLTNANDQQVFYCQWTNGSWGTAQQFTTNSLGNRNARAAVATAGSAYLVWQQGTNLVMSVNFSTNTSLVRADSQTAGFADYAMTFGPAGNLVLLWQEMSEQGSDAHYAVHDPASLTWSKDARLFQDAALERSFAPVWDNVGNLTFAYNKVQIGYTNKTVTLEGGGTVTITNVPQPGRVDLCVMKRALVRDLALQAGDFGVSGGNFLPGDAVTLSATVRNTGNVAVSNIVVQFWDGNPTNGGTLITNVTLSGWLEGAATNVATALWIVPEPATNHVLYAIVNPSLLGSEFDELNNQQSVNVGGTDLAASLVSYSVETNGAVRVIAQVQNLGAPSATNSVLAIRRDGQTNAPLTTTAIPLLEPGRLAQVALDLPPGTQAEGEMVYRLFADETRVINDVETNNNTTAFAVNLFLDFDNDGISDGWETANGLSPSNAADASLDNDSDGLSNLAEYRAGTDPNNANSFLAVETVVAGNVTRTNGWVQITWGSQSNRLYEIQRAATVAGPFAPLSSHILSTPPLNTFLDTTATNASQFFYRLRVE